MNSLLKRHVAATATGLLDRFGYSLVPTWRFQNHALSTHLAKLLEQFDIDCIIDVGANDGGYVRFLRMEVGYRGLILSFEPVSALADKCRAAATTDPHWQVLQFAGGDRDYETSINVSSYTPFSSLLPAVEAPPEAFIDLMAVSHQETVQVRRLDGILPALQSTYGYRRPYLKVDTQGFDLAVFTGAGILMETMVAAQTELSFRPIYKGMPSWRDVLDLMETHRFSVSNMFAVSTDASLRAIEFDCILVNDRSARKT